MQRTVQFEKQLLNYIKRIAYKKVDNNGTIIE